MPTHGAQELSGPEDQPEVHLSGSFAAFFASVPAGVSSAGGFTGAQGSTARSEAPPPADPLATAHGSPVKTAAPSAAQGSVPRTQAPADAKPPCAAQAGTQKDAEPLNSVPSAPAEQQQPDLAAAFAAVVWSKAPASSSMDAADGGVAASSDGDAGSGSTQAAQCSEGASAAARQEFSGSFLSPSQAAQQGPSGDPKTGRKTVRRAPFTRPGRPSQGGADKATGLAATHEPAEGAAVPDWDLCASVLSSVLGHVYSLPPLCLPVAPFIAVGVQ